MVNSRPIMRIIERETGGSPCFRVTSQTASSSRPMAENRSLEIHAWRRARHGASKGAFQGRQRDCARYRRRSRTRIAWLPDAIISEYVASGRLVRIMTCYPLPQDHTDTRLKIAVEGRALSSIVPASSSERGAHRLACRRMGRCGSGVGSHPTRL